MKTTEDVEGLLLLQRKSIRIFLNGWYLSAILNILSNTVFGEMVSGHGVLFHDSHTHLPRAICDKCI